MQIIKRLISFFFFVLIATLFASITLFILERRESFVIVPSLQGKDIISARGILEKTHLKIKESASYHKTIPKDYVISQTPEQGRKVRAYSKVNVVISLGMSDVSIPRIIGRDLYSSKIILSTKGLALGNITYIHSDKSKDTVLGFSSEKDEIKEGDRINLLVSAGKKTEFCLTPDLSFLSLDVASSTLKENGLILGGISLTPGTEGIVLKQKPIPGMRINKGTRVDVTIGIEE